MAKRGRPTDYRPEYCDQAVELMRQGMSQCEVACEFDVDEDTLYEWKKKHKDFSEAIKKGESFSKGWWLKVSRTSLFNKDFNYKNWDINMRNRFDWSNKIENTIIVKQEDALKALE